MAARGDSRPMSFRATRRHTRMTALELTDETASRARSSAIAASCRCTATGCWAPSRSPRTSRRRRSCARGAKRDLRGARVGAGVAVPDRDQRVPGRAGEAPAPADGRAARSSGCSRTRTSCWRPRRRRGADVVARETIELAFMVAIQYLAPRPRAVLILRDVLGWRRGTRPSCWTTTVAAVNSALQRARASLKEHLPAERERVGGGGQCCRARARERSTWRPREAGDAQASEGADARGGALLDAARAGACTSAATRSSTSGSRAVSATEDFGELRSSSRAPTASPRVANYHRKPGEDALHRRSRSTCCGSRTGRSRTSPPSNTRTLRRSGSRRTCKGVAALDE